MTDAIVSTECPSCGAPLDFAHGANAIQCGHCRSNLLVTGHRQILSYQIDPWGDGKTAADRVRAALGREQVSVGEARLYFVPYYRLTGHEFRWVRPAPPPPERAVALGDAFLGGVPAGDPLADGALSPLEFQDRYVDRTFLALDLPELGVPSLGVRASVLRLRLARPSAVEPHGQFVAVEMQPDVAVGLGMQPAEPRGILHRTVVGRVLSVIHFPFWIVPLLDEGGSSGLAVVDGVAEALVKVDASASLLARLERLAPAAPETLGFRPLLCPNCGWDLPLRPDDVIFFCKSCARTWQLHGAELRGIHAEVANVPPARPGAPVKYLPCWVLDTDEAGRPRRFLVPAFRYRRLKLLNDLGRRLSVRQPTWSPLGGEPPDLVGGHYDVEDAVLLARFLSFAPGLPGGDAPGNITVNAATVAWFPFAVENRELLDPFTGLALPEQLLL